MGYCTRYELTTKEIHPGENLLQSVLGEPGPDFKKILASKDYAEWNVFEEPCKWYDHEEDLKTLSKKYPGTVFILDGEGEEYPDIWRKTFFRGKMHVAKASIEFLPPPPGFLA